MVFVWFQINEFVDARDLNMGAWFEAQIVNVTREAPPPEEAEEAESQPGQEAIRYHVK